MFPDWPLMNGVLLPIGGATDPLVRRCTRPTSLHRYVAGVVLLIVAGRRRARRGARSATGPRSSASRWRWPSCTRSRWSSAASRSSPSSPTGRRRSTSPSARSSGRLAAALAVAAYYEARGRRRRRASASARRAAGDGGDDGTAGTPARTPRRHGPRLHRPDQAADHRAAARHHDPGDGPRDPRPARDEPPRVAAARVLDARVRLARGGLRQRHQPVPRPRHRPPDGPHPAPAAAGPRGHARERAGVRDRPRGRSRSCSWRGPSTSWRRS